MGKFMSKYLIIDILPFGCSLKESFDLLYLSCSSIRTLYRENNPMLFNESEVKPMQSLDVSMISQLYINDSACYHKKTLIMKFSEITPSAHLNKKCLN